MLLILLSLISKVISSPNYFVLTPVDHRYCLNRAKYIVMNRLSVDYRKLSVKIEPNISSRSFTTIRSLCPITIIQPSRKLVKESYNDGREIVYWFLTMKISGDFSSCANYLSIGELNNDFNKSEVAYMEKSGKQLDCRSKLPMIIHSKYRQFGIWWMWSKETLPRLQIDFISYIRFIGDFTDKQKMKSCSHAMGFWCGTVCIDGKARCDGVDDCAVFSSSKVQSADELNCQTYNYSANAGNIKNEPANESSLASNLLYIFLGVVGLILLISACKIFITNFVLSKRLRRKMKFPSANSPLYSLSTGESDNESAYADVQEYCDDESKKNSSIMISGDEETQEEILGASKEYIDSIYDTTEFQPQLIAPKKPCDKSMFQNEITKTYKIPTLVQLHSLSSYQIKDYSSNATHSNNVSLTGNILSQGHSAILEMNSPGSSRTFRKILNKNMNKTSSYDKILMYPEISSNTSSREEDILGKPDPDSKPKSHTISRLEMNHSSGKGNDDNNFTSYIIV